MKKPTRILIAEDAVADADVAQRTIRKVLKHCEFHVVGTRKNFLAALKTFQPDVILADYSLPQFSGMQALRLALKHTPLTPLIIWTGSINEDTAVDYMKAGASNYVLKDNLQRLGPAVLRALEERQLLLERRLANERYQAIFENSADGIFQSAPEGRYINVNPAMAKIYKYDSPQDLIESVVDISSQVYLETGERHNFIKLLEEQGIIENYEQKNRCKDGSVIWTSTSARAVRNVNGEILYIEGFVRNITARKLMEERLREGESKYRTLVEQLPAITYISRLDQYMGVSYVSPQVESLGFDAEEWLADPELWFRQIHPEDQGRVLAALEEFRTGGEIFRAEYRLVLPSGSTRWIDDRSVYVRDQNGEPLFKQGFMLDITERKQAEEAFQRNESRFRALLENGLDDISLLTADGTLLWESPSTVRNLGYQPNEFVGRNIFEIMHPDDRGWTSELYNDLIQEPGSRKQGLFRLRRVDGSWRWMEAIVTNLLEEQGIHAIVANYRDVTERKQAEERLRQSESRYRLAIKATDDVIWEWNPQRNQLIWSGNAPIVLGYAPEEIAPYAKWWDERLHPDDCERVVTKLNNLIWGNESIWLDEYRFRRKDGSYAHISDRGYVERDENGTPLRMIGAMSDNSERKQADVERQALMEITQGLAQPNDLNDLLGLIHQSVAKVIYAENFFVVLYQPHSALFEEIYSVDQYDPPEPPSRLEKSITSYVFRSGEPLLLTQARFDELEALGEVKLIGTNSKSWLGVPLKTSGRTIGVMAVQDYENENRYSERDRDFLTSIAAQVGLVIERKQAEEALRESEERFSSAFEYAPIGMGLVAPDGRWLRVNKSLCELVGYAREELLAKTFQEMTHPDDLEVDLEFVRQMLVGEIDSYQIEKRYFHKWGHPIWILLSVSLVRDNQGQPRYFISQIQDITQRKQAEDKLRFEKERFDSIAATVPGIICSFRLRPDGSACMPFASPAIQDVYGFLPEELLDDITPLMARIHPDDLPHTNAAIAESARTMLPWHNEFRYQHPSKGEIWIEGQSVPVQEPDGGMIWHGFIYDITERKRAEAAEREQRALAEALRDTAETLSSTLDYGEVLDHILAAAGRVVPHDAATIMLIEGESAQVVRSQGYEKHGFNEKILEIKLPLMETTNLRLMLETRQPIVVFDTHSYPGWMRLQATDWLRSNVGAPILIYGEVIGFILLDSQTPEFFTLVHAERLQAFANQAALAIHNARLLLQAQVEIVERKQAEKELRASEERFRQLADNIQEAFWITDAETDAEVYMSPAVEKIWGQPIDHLMRERNSFLNSVYPEDRPAIREAIEREKNGERVEIEYRIVQTDGSLRWVWDRAFPIFDESGKVIRIAGISADITERRESELALVRSQSRYRELFDSSPISLWEEDFSEVRHQINLLQKQGITDLNEYLSSHPDVLARLASMVRITDANQAALALYRLDQKEALLKSLPQVISLSALSHFQEEIHGLMSPAKRFVWEGSDQMVDGRQMVVMVTGSIPQGYEEDWSKVLVSVSDITERKRAEEELRRRAEETAALLETSLALTDLDLNAILRTISNSAKALFAADGCRIFLMEPDGETLRCVLALQENFEAFSELRIRVGEGVTGAVAASGQAEIVNQMQNDPRAVQVAGTPNEEEAIMFAPLKERERTIGVLSIRRVGSEHHFQPADLELLEALAAMAASAVSNARLFEETQRRLAELEALYENGLAVGRLLEPRQIGDRLIETFARYLRWHHVTIRLRREASDDLELVAFNLPHLNEEERTIAENHFVTLINKVGQGLSGWVMQTGKVLRTGNVHVHPQYVHMHSGIQSGLYMPLKAGERVIGVISVESEVPDAFTEQDERLLATLASQAAIAFENARLYETIQKELSERKRAEEALRASEAHYRELANSITDILFELDHEMHYTHWNKASEALTGIPASYAIGKPMRDIFGAVAEQSTIEEIFEGVRRDRQPKTFEMTLELSGTKRSFEVNAYPSRRGVSVVAKDVTDRKRAEMIMQKRFQLMEYSAGHTLSELIQRTVDEASELTGSTIGFLHFVESDQNQLGLQVWSTNALRVFNVPLGEGAHRPLDEAGLWAEAARQRRPLIQNDYASIPVQTGLPPGHEPISREMVIPIIRNEKLVAIVGIANKPQDYTSDDLEAAARLADYAWDITERKQMEIALQTERNQLVQRVEERTADLSRANSNLARALRVKDEFLANMSHELRTPLNAILGLSESLAEQIAGPLNEKQQKYITTIGESGHHLLALINDILDLAKIEAGQITLDINKVDIHSVCQASLRMVKQLAQKKNQEITLKIEAGLGLMWADERRLKQMMVNLLGNAVKFTPDGGTIGLDVHGDEEANKVTITVWDTGIGIKPEDLERLFQPFVQLDSGLAREATGTGLGLALVAQMARLHGGSVTASSEPGIGSRFSIVLPWEPALALDSATRMRITGKFRAVQPDETKKPTILLVEDTKEVIMMIQDYLELAGYKIVTAQDGVDAIVQAKLVHPDLILMDVQMPRMDGMEATRKLRSEPEFRYTPIIALTALAMPNDRERCLSAGMDEYISKPVNLKALVKIIQSCLLGTQELSHP